MNFPTKGLSERKAEEWLKENNPYAPGTVIGNYFERDFYLSQAAIFQAKANKLGKWAIGLLMLALAVNLTVLVLRLIA